jgi:uncharacterized membrane protein
MMNAAHWHLMLNHVPVLGTGFGLVLLAWAVVRKSEELKKVSLTALVVGAALAVPAYLTGEPAEALVERLPEVSKALLEMHEEVAQLAFIGTIVVGVAALVGRLRFRRAKGVPGWFAGLILVASLMVFALLAWTANLGGQIRHTEIRSATSTSY